MNIYASKLREIRGKSKREMAGDLQISPRFLLLIKLGKKQPSLELDQRIKTYHRKMIVTQFLTKQIYQIISLTLSVLKLFGGFLGFGARALQHAKLELQGRYLGRKEQISMKL